MLGGVGGGLALAPMTRDRHELKRKIATASFDRGGMGARGPAPKPTVLRELAGNPGGRPLNRREPKPRQRRPKPPGWLTAEQLGEWKRLVRILHPTRVLTEADADLLALYCQHHAVWRRANKELDVSGFVITTDKGYPMQSTWLSISMQAAKQMARLLAELGMTPAARTRIQVSEETPDDAFDRYLS